MPSFFLPTIDVRSLIGTNLIWPNDLDSALTIIIVAYQLWHQDTINSWTESFLDIKKNFTQLDMYTLLVIEYRYRLIRWFIDNGIKRTMQNATLLNSTFTSYTSVDLFRKSLDIRDTKSISVLLVNNLGGVLWSSRGYFDSEQFTELYNALRHEYEQR